MTQIEKHEIASQQLPADRTVFFARHVSYGYDDLTGVRQPSAVREYDSWEEVSTRSGVRIGSYLEVPFIYKWLLLTCLIVCIAVGWFVLLVMPRTYASESKLLIKVGRESVALDPTATTSQTMMLQKTQEEEIISALEVLGSRQIHQDVVNRLGADSILAGQLPDHGPAERSWLNSRIGWVRSRISDLLDFTLIQSGVRDPISDNELAVRELQDIVGIYSPKKSTVITIDVDSKTPEMAQAIAQTVTDVFLDTHLKAAQTPGSQNFFKHESAEAEAKLTELNNRKTQLLQDREIVSVDARRSLLNERLKTIDRDIVAAQGALEQATAEIQDLSDKIDRTEDEIVASKIEGSDATWSGMRQRVYELELLEKSLSSKYTDNHRTLIATRDQLKGARMILAKLRSDRVDQSMTPNPAKRRMEEDLQRLQTKMVGLQSSIEEKEKQRAETQDEVHDLARFELAMLQIDRNISLLQSSLRVLQEKREEARVLDELQSKKISNISVFQPATFVERPIKPNKKVLAAGFVFLGLMSGIGLAFLREASSTTLRTTQHVEANLRCPVVLKVPRRRSLEFAGLSSGPGDDNPMRKHCQSILSDILLSRAEPINQTKRGQTLGVIGVDAGCGASTLASALAMASSDDCGLKTTLIDGDSQGRTVSKSFGLNGTAGLMELVSGDATNDDCVQRLKHSELSLISYCSPSASQNRDSNPRDILLALQELSQQSDLVIVDLPPASQPNQAVGLAKHLDHVLVVVESEKTEIAAAERLLRRLSDGNVQVVGVVLNKTKCRMPKWIGNYVSA